MAAAGSGRTERPGPGSFTHHLIAVLREECIKKDGKPISTFGLNEMTMKRRRNTSSHVFSRYGKRNGQHIMLAPSSQKQAIVAPIHENQCGEDA